MRYTETCMTDQADHSAQLNAALDALRGLLQHAWNVAPPFLDESESGYVFVVRCNEFPKQNVVLTREFFDNLSAQEIGEHIRRCPIKDRLGSGLLGDVVVTKDGLKP